MAHTFEQFVRFTTDAAGLERTFRLLQSITQILSSYTLPFECLLLLLNYVSPGPAGLGPNPKTARAVLLVLRGRLALVRRYFRLFRFLESFGAAQELYLSLSSSSSLPSASSSPASGAVGDRRRRPRWIQADVWLDVFGRTFNGMYLLLEASTIVDVQQIPGFAVWGAERERAVALEAQRFWLFALVCGVFSGLFKMFKVLAYTPIPATGGGYGYAQTEAEGKSEGEISGEKASSQDGSPAREEGGKGGGEGEAEKEDSTAWDLKREQARLRRIVKDRKLARVAWRREVRAKLSALGRRVVADALDITLPGSAVGWVQADAGTVGSAMFVTTILTGMEVWERCGRKVDGRKL